MHFLTCFSPFDFQQQQQKQQQQQQQKQLIEFLSMYVNVLNEQLLLIKKCEWGFKRTFFFNTDFL